LDSPGAEGAIYTGINAAGSILGQYVNNVLTITYGTRRIVILGGQTPESIRGVRSIILGYLRKHERQYGNANDNDVANYEAAALRGQSQNIDIGNGWGSSELRHLLKIRWLAVALVSLIIGFIGIAWRALDVGFNGNTLNFVTVVLVASTAVFVAISIAIVGIRALMLLVKPTS
jgi:hypothetical protein